MANKVIFSPLFFSKCFEGIKCAKKKINGDSYHENERFYSVNIYEVQVVPYIS